jgi:hypothetical protein
MYLQDQGGGGGPPSSHLRMAPVPTPSVFFQHCRSGTERRPGWIASRRLSLPCCWLGKCGFTGCRRLMLPRMEECRWSNRWIEVSTHIATAPRAFLIGATRAGISAGNLLSGPDAGGGCGPSNRAAAPQRPLTRPGWHGIGLVHRQEWRRLMRRDPSLAIRPNAVALKHLSSIPALLHQPDPHDPSLARAGCTGAASPPPRGARNEEHSGSPRLVDYPGANGRWRYPPPRGRKDGIGAAPGYQRRHC